MQVRLDLKSMVPRQRRQKSLLTLLSAPDLYTASARFRVAFPLEYSPKVYQSTEPKRQETGPEGRQSRHHSLSSHITHISMRPVVRHGTVPALRSGHGRHQAAGPPVPAPVEPRTSSDGRLHPEVSVPSPSS